MYHRPIRFICVFPSGRSNRLLSRRANLADPSSKSERKAYEEMCQMMLRSGLGAAFSVQPCQVISPFFLSLKIYKSAFSSVFFSFQNFWICRISKISVEQFQHEISSLNNSLNFEVLLPINTTAKGLLMSEIPWAKNKILGTEKWAKSSKVV